MRKFIVNVGLVCVCACTGCDQSEEIRHYRAAKPATQAEPAKRAVEPSTAERPPAEAHQSATNAADQRMLAAIVMHADQAWFFKSLGPTSQLEPQVDTFRLLLKSVRFTAGKPQWDLPDGWRQKGESGMRYATLEFGPVENPVELTVIPLPIPPGDRAAYVLSNVNRWRQQLNLSPIAATELDQQSEELELDGATGVVVDLAGN
jgi:hypothetical protein